MFLYTWLHNQGNLESYPHIELTFHQHWNPHKIEFPQTKYSVQEEVEGRNVSKAAIFFSGETPIDTDRTLDRCTRGDFGSHNKEVVVHTGMGDCHRHILADIAVTATHESYILTVNRDKKREILLAVISKEKSVKYC